MSESQYLTCACDYCQGNIEFPAEGVGTVVDCPHCAARTVLRSGRQQPTEPADAISASDLQAAFAGAMGRPRPPVMYTVGIVFAAVVMVLLPVAYLGLIGVAGYGVYWYARAGAGLFFAGGLTGGLYVMLFKLAFYVGPLLGGAISVIFMLKPLLARPLRSAQPLAVNPASDPRLYQFIAHLSDLTGAPMPKRIDLDCTPNAAAGFRRGFLSFLGHDLVLVLGLPLIAGMNTRQLAAVVAHEFGHYSQGFGMRLDYVVRRVDDWFARVIYQRDAWDAALDQFAESAEGWFMSIIAACARFGVWLSRLGLKLLLVLDHAVVCFLCRQSEYHADRYAVAVAGSDAYESTLLRLNEQALLFGVALEGLDRFWGTKRQLPENLPGFLRQLEMQMPATFHDDAQNTLLNQGTRLFDTHPTVAQRIRHARLRSDPGVFHLEAPASALFSNFQVVSWMVTSVYYRDTLSLPVTDQMLKPTAHFFAGADRT